jgi:hypothetical protein
MIRGTHSASSFLDPHRFDANPDAGPSFHFDADPDPDHISSFTHGGIIFYFQLQQYHYFSSASYTGVMIFNIVHGILKFSEKSLI